MFNLNCSPRVTNFSGTWDVAQSITELVKTINMEGKKTNIAK